MLARLCRGRKANFSGRGDGLSRRAAVVQISVSILACSSLLSPGIGFSITRIETLTCREVSWLTAITVITSPIGALLAAFCYDRVGRKTTILLADIASIIQWTLIVFSGDGDVLFAELLLARALAGISLGMCATPMLIFLAEISHPRIRGSLLALAPLFLALGSITIDVIEKFAHDFRSVSTYALAVTLVATLASLSVPETPVYLVTKNKLGDARRALSMLHNVYKHDAKIDDEIRAIREMRDASDASVWWWREFEKPELLRPFLAAHAFMVVQQLCGICVIYFFPARFVDIDEMVVRASGCVGTLLAGLIADIVGRKGVAVVSSAGMFASMTGLALCSFFGTALDWLPTVLLIFFAIAGALGVLTLPVTMLGEVFTVRTKGLGVGISLSVLFLLTFITTKTFVAVFDAFGSAAVFSFYALISLLGIFFSAFVLPETKGRTLQQIENYFRG